MFRILPLIQDVDLPGQGRAAHAAPNFATTARIAPGRWLILLNTVDALGCDANRSILWQLRAGTPQGSILGQGVLAAMQRDLDPLGDGSKFWWGNSTPQIFGVPTDADSPCAGHFMVIFNRKLRLIDGDRLTYPTPKAGWPDDVPAERWRAALAHLTPYVRAAHLQLNDSGDGITVTAGPDIMRQVGYAAGAEACQHGGPITTEPWCRPVSTRRDGTEWVQVVAYNPTLADHSLHDARGSVLMAVRYRWDPVAHRFAWVECGTPLRPFDEREEVGEPTLVQDKRNAVRS
jgi:hypothetical protein